MIEQLRNDRDFIVLETSPLPAAAATLALAALVEAARKCGPGGQDDKRRAEKRIGGCGHFADANMLSVRAEYLWASAGRSNPGSVMLSTRKRHGSASETVNNNDTSASVRVRPMY